MTRSATVAVRLVKSYSVNKLANGGSIRPAINRCLTLDDAVRSVPNQGSHKEERHDYQVLYSLENG